MLAPRRRDNPPPRQFNPPPQQRQQQQQQQPQRNDNAGGNHHRGPGPHMGDWLRRHEDLPPTDQQKQLEKDPNLQKLPQDRQH